MHLTLACHTRRLRFSTQADGVNVEGICFVKSTLIGLKRHTKYLVSISVGIAMMFSVVAPKHPSAFLALTKVRIPLGKYTDYGNTIFCGVN